MPLHVIPENELSEICHPSVSSCIATALHCTALQGGWKEEDSDLLYGLLLLLLVGGAYADL